MKCKPIPYSEAKLINKYVAFMNAMKEPVLSRHQNEHPFDVSNPFCSNSLG